MLRSTPNWLYVEEQLDTEGDLIWVVPQLGVSTHDRSVLDRIADLSGKELSFGIVPIGS